MGNDANTLITYPISYPRHSFKLRSKCPISKPRPINTIFAVRSSLSLPVLLLPPSSSKSTISKTSRTPWIIFVVPSVVRMTPLRRWMEKLGVGGDGGVEKGRVESQRMERSQDSRVEIWGGGMGGRGRVIVEIVWGGRSVFAKAGYSTAMMER